MQPRTTVERIADAKRRLDSEANFWLATASSDGAPHLVALSLWWDGHVVRAATPARNPVARNIAATGLARLSLPDAEDVVAMKCHAATSNLDDLGTDQARHMVDALGWDPREESGEWVLLTLEPNLVWSWNGLHEDEGRTIMRDGVWLD